MWSLPLRTHCDWPSLSSRPLPVSAPSCGSLVLPVAAPSGFLGLSHGDTGLCPVSLLGLEARTRFPRPWPHLPILTGASDDGCVSFPSTEPPEQGRAALLYCYLTPLRVETQRERLCPPRACSPGHELGLSLQAAPWGSGVYLSSHTWRCSRQRLYLPFQSGDKGCGFLLRLGSPGARLGSWAGHSFLPLPFPAPHPFPWAGVRCQGSN